MQEQLFNYIRDHSTTPLTAEETEVIKNTMVPKKIRKRQYFLQKGEVCKSMAFILKGSMRQYSVDDKGNEHIIRLSIENWWAGDRESFLKGTPTDYNIDAWEETEVLLLPIDGYLSILKGIPALGEMARRLDENHAFAYQKRLNAFISLSAEERYADLAKMYPEFLQRFPQHIIASYLGITKETLSRVRNHAREK